MSRSLVTLVLGLALTAPAAAQAPTDGAKSSKPVRASRIRTMLQAVTGGKALHPSRCKALGELAALGPAASAALMPHLDSKDVKMRAAAVSAAGQMRLAEAGPKLLERMDDQDALVRSAALTAIGFVQPKGAVKALAGALGAKDTNQRIAAAMALGHTGSPGAVEPLLRALDDFHPKVKGAAARSLGSLGDKRATIAIATMLARPDVPWPAARASAEALGTMGDPNGVPMLIFALGHAQPQVRVQAIRSLGRLKDARAVTGVSLLLKDANLAVEAATGLGHIGSADALPGLIRVLKERRLPPAALEKAFWAIGSIQSTSAVSAIQPFLADEDPRMAVWAADCLGRLGDESIVRDLIKALRRPEKDVTEMAAWALQKISGKPLGTEAARWEQWLEAEEAARAEQGEP